MKDLRNLRRSGSAGLAVETQRMPCKLVIRFEVVAIEIETRDGYCRLLKDCPEALLTLTQSEFKSFLPGDIDTDGGND